MTRREQPKIAFSTVCGVRAHTLSTATLTTLSTNYSPHPTIFDDEVKAEAAVAYEHLIVGGYRERYQLSVHPRNAQKTFQGRAAAFQNNVGLAVSCPWFRHNTDPLVKIFATKEKPFEVHLVPLTHKTGRV